MAQWFRRCLASAGAAILVAACGAGSTPVPSATPATFVEDIAVDGDRTLHIVCLGPTDSGRPTVVYENGGGAELETWSDVTDGLAATDRACAYDRAGIGKSAAAAGPRTTQDQVDDLAAVLDGASISGPIVLVGHSSGGFNVLLYAGTYPDRIVGAVLVDIRPPSLTARLLAELPPETADEPDAIHDWREALTTFETDFTMNPEGLLLEASTEQVVAAPGFGDRPVVFLWSEPDAAVWDGLDADLAARMGAALQAARADAETLSDEPTVSLIDAGHFIHEEKPDVVIDAILRVLDQLEP